MCLKYTLPNFDSMTIDVDHRMHTRKEAKQGELSAYPRHLTVSHGKERGRKFNLITFPKK
jgi:hypothetical protein